MARRSWWLGVVVAALLVPGVAGAQDFTEGVRPLGMGEAYTAVASGTGALYHNPAGIARNLMYAVEGTYEYNPFGSVLNAAVVDSKTNPDVAAGVSYSYFFGRGDFSEVSGHDFRLGLALPVVPERVSVGVAGRYLITEADGVETIRGFTLDAGVLFRPANQLHVGVAGRNLIDVCPEDEFCAGVAPTIISGGLGFGDDTTFMLSADVGADLTTDPDGAALLVEAGAEFLAGGVFPLRAGFQHNAALDANYATGGLGWRSETAGVDLGARIDTGDADNLWINGSFSVYF